VLAPQIFAQRRRHDLALDTGGSSKVCLPRLAAIGGEA